MAGRKQHYLPVSLLRGFSKLIDRAEKVDFVRSGAAPIVVSIRDLAHSRDFYSSPADPRLDDSITDYEGERFAPTLAALRANPSIGGGLQDAVFELIAHQAVRTDSMRQVGSTAIRTVAEKIEPEVTSPPFIEREIDKLVDPEGGGIEKLVLEAARQGGVELTAEQLAFVAGLARKQMVAQRDKAVAFVRPAMQSAMKKVAETADELAARGHRKGLSTSLSPESRQQALRQFSARVLVVGGGESLILGDSAVVGIDHNGEPRSAVADYDELAAIVLPIAHDRAIALTRQSTTEGLIRPEAINVASASLAWRFFVAFPGAGAAPRYAHLVGSRANPFENLADDLD